MRRFSLLQNRAVESDKSDESKSLKKSKRQKKSDKVKQVGFDFLSDFWQKKSTTLMEMS